MNQIASELAFEESILTIVPALKDQEWQLIDREYKTPINNALKQATEKADEKIKGYITSGTDVIIEQ